MFLGEYLHAVDTKGRVAVPAKFRAQLSSGAVITRGLDGCLFVFPKGEWESLAGKLMELPLSQANSRAFVRLMLSGASDVEFDTQGRVLVPEPLRSYARIEKKVVITGLFNRIEIWDDAAWSAYKKKTEKASDEIAERMGELGV